MSEEEIKDDAVETPAAEEPKAETPATEEAAADAPATEEVAAEEAPKDPEKKRDIFAELVGEKKKSASTKLRRARTLLLVSFTLLLHLTTLSLVLLITLVMLLDGQVLVKWASKVLVRALHMLRRLYPKMHAAKQ